VIGAEAYHVGIMSDIGWISRQPDGTETAHTWTEILSYAKGVATISNPWEFRTVFKMSSAYLAGKILGQNPFSKHPIDMRDNPDG